VVQGMLRRHCEYTDSAVAARILGDWEELSRCFVRVMPRDYKKALKRIKEETGR
jgi:glutamate synthase (NADPH) large chain